MFNIKELEKTRLKNYKVWFERFIKKENLDREIEISNEKGFTGYSIPLNGLSERDKRMAQQETFINLLEKRYIGLKIKREVETTYIFNIKRTEESVLISWR